ncbi:YaiI/YqxD family protein [Neptunomonas sp.]|uniref:YaiI/YqxD family protein n=1 Tax=Neptunomonas sp. TaxID=1971898 RepID=UPI0025DD111B|nr:YaiI/YqxD family protein [Neptunomonas sp.]
MHIWVDADACPRVIKDILFRAAERTNTTMTLVANQLINTPPTPLINAIRVPAGFDVADNYIVQKLAEGDLVITADIPLAAEVVENKGIALNPRGELYTTENIRQLLSMRDFMDTLRNTGVETGGPKSLNEQDRRTFANKLDSLLAKIR